MGLRVVQAIGWYYPETVGGTEVYVAALSRRLAAASHDVTVVAPDPGGTLERTYQHDGISVYRYPIAAVPTRAEARGGPMRGAEHLHRWLAAHGADVVHLHTFVPGMGLPEVRAAKNAGARVIVTTHSSRLGFLCQRGDLFRFGAEVCDGVCRPTRCAACMLATRGVPRPLAWAVGAFPPAFGAWAERMPIGRLGTALGMSELIRRNRTLQDEMLDLVDRFVVLTEAALTRVLANGAPRGKVALNRLGVSHRNVRRKNDLPTALPVRIGYLGRFEPIKGVTDLLRAVIGLAREVPLRLEIRGPARTEADRAALRDLERLARDDPRVTFGPEVASDAVLDLLGSWDLLCCPSRSLEGGPTVALEAHAVGTPVVGSRIGGLAEIVNERTGALVPPGDVGALRDLFSRVAGNPAQTIDRWRSALGPVRTMDDVTADYLEMYRV